MNRAPVGDAVWSIDDLELELRKLPGVRAAGFDEIDDVLMVQLHVSDRDERAERAERSEHSDRPLPVTASRIAARHSDRPVTMEVIRWRSLPVDARTAPLVSGTESAAGAPTEGTFTPRPNRARLLAVLAFPDTDELEVHLVLEGRRTIGRAPASAGIEGAVVATIDAVHDLGTGIEAQLRWARPLDESGQGDEGEQVAVALALDGDDGPTTLHYGLAGGASLIDAAARATLDALNRRLSRSN